MSFPRQFVTASFFILSAFLLGGCGLLYTNIRLPYSYNAATPSDVHGDKEDPLVTGQSCNQSVIYLVAWGNAGYAAAVQVLPQALPPLSPKQRFMM